MPAVEEWDRQVVEDFVGARPDLEPDDLPIEAAFLSQNVEYTHRGWMSRRPFALLFNAGVAGTIRSFFNWVYAGFNRVLYLSVGAAVAIRIREISTGDDRQAGTVVSSDMMVAANAGSRAYVALANTSPSGPKMPTGAQRAQVIGQDPASPATIQMEGIWEPPPGAGSFTFSAASFNSTVFGVTAGVHKIAILLTTRSGFETALVEIGSYTSVGGQDTLSVVFGGGISASFYSAKLLAAPVNSLRYFEIPQADNIRTVLSGSWDFLFRVDDVMLSAGREIDIVEGKYFYGKNSVNLNPHSIVAYGSRIAYIGEIPDPTIANNKTSAVWFSEPGLPQDIFLDKSMVQVTGNLKVTAGVVIGDIFYALGPSYTFGIPGNLVDSPSLWPPPYLVDDKIGARDQDCIAADQSRQYMFVANPSGLWLFRGGAYKTRAVSHYQHKTWKRINWNASVGTVRVVDDSENYVVKVIAPLDGASTPTHHLVWNYQDSQEEPDPESCKFSLDPIGSRTAGMILRSDGSGSEFCVAPSSGTDRVWRQMRRGESGEDNGQDEGAAFTSIYETARLPGKSQRVLQAHGFHTWASGAGSLGMTVYDRTGIRAEARAPLALSANPNAPAFRPIRSLRSEEYRVRYSITGGRVEVSSIVFYYTRLMPKRP